MVHISNFKIRILIYSFVSLMFSNTLVKSQTTEHSKGVNNPSTNARQVIKTLNNQFNSIEENNENGIKENFIRWRNFWSPRLTQYGKLYNVVDYAYKYTTNGGCPQYTVVNNCETQGNSNIPSNWKSIGTLPNGKQKQGKVTAIWNNAANSNHYMIGTAGSGLWKTTNNGTSWTNLTDVLKLPGFGVSSIVVKPGTNNQTIWISSGAGFWNYDFGIFKSTDGGASWCYEPLDGNNPWPYASDRSVYKIVINPNNSDQLACISNQALYATNDGGNNWVKIYYIPDPGNSSIPDKFIDLRELEIDPNNPSQVYISTVMNFNEVSWAGIPQNTQCKFYRIENIWNAITNLSLLTTTDLTSNISSISPNITTVGQQRISFKIRSSGEVVASCGTGGFLINSTDNGNTWSKVSNSIIPPTMYGGLGYYLNPLVLDPANSNHYYLGGTELVEAKMVGASIQFIVAPNGYQYFSDYNPNTHADIICLNISNGTLYVGCDGGIFSGNVNTPTWQTRNGDLSTSHVGGLGTNKSNGSIVGASQDNQASIKDKNGVWNTTMSYGDGYEAEYESSRSVANNGFVMGNGGWVYSFGNDNSNYTGSTSMQGDVINSLQSTEEGNYGGLYTFNFLKLLRADNQYKTNGTSIANYTGSSNNLTITGYKVKDAQPTTIYMGLQEPTSPYSTFALVKTTNGSFTGSETYLQTFADPILTIAVDNSIQSTASDRVWVGLGDVLDVTDASGNIDPNKINKRRVYYSCNGGSTFTDVSKGLPVFPIIKLLYDEQSKYLYAATDAGVYVLNTSVAVADQEWFCFSNGLPPTVLTDIDLNRCTNKLTVATQGRGIWETELPWNSDYLNQSDASNTEVLGNGGSVIWSTDKNVTKTIIVKNNTQLRIKGTIANPITINMAQRRAIIVEKGSSLVVENATITNECGKFWTGISVMGDPGLNQCNMPTVMSYATAQCANQGVVWLTNATIENAIIGVRTGDVWYQSNDDWPHFSCCGGGIIIAENSKFLNNRKAVEFMTYNKFFNRSRFLYCDFISDDYLYGYYNASNNPVGSLEFITAWDVKRVKIDHCNFSVNTSASFNEIVDNYPTAIGAFDARLDITNNTFNKVRYGVTMSYSPTNAMYPVLENNTLNNAWRGIYIGCCMKPHQILNNTISLTNNSDYVGPCASNTGLNEAFGIYEDNATGIQIRENTINYTPDYSTNVNDRNYGIIFHNSTVNGTSSVRVRRNTINELNFGITAMGDNRKAQISCNQFNNAMPAPSNLINIYNSNSQDANCNIVYNGKLESPQGSCSGLTTTPAGNKFSDCPIGVDRFYSDPSVNQVFYNEHGNNPFRVDLCSTGDVVANNCGIPCNDIATCCPPDPIDPWGGVVIDKNVILAQVQLAHSQKEMKRELIDGGSTSNLLDMLNDVTNSSTYLHQEFLELGNYLSDEVLMRVIDRPIYPFSNYELTSLIIANSPITENVYNLLDQVRPLVANNYLVYLAQQNGISDRAILEGEINDLQKVEDDRLQRLVDEYLSEENSSQAIAYLLEYGHKEQAIPLLVEQQNYITAQNVINTFDDPDLRMVYNIDMSYKMNNQTIMSLTADDKEILNSIKDKSTTAGVFARNMLGFVNNTYIPKVMPPMPQTNSNRKSLRVLNYEKFTPESNFAVFPNPSSGHITVLSYFDKYSSTSKLVVTDLTGKKVLETTLDEGKQKVNVDLSSLSNGTYMLTIFNNAKQVFQTKQIVVNAH